MIIDNLVRRINELRAPIVVGLDPRIESFPEHIKNEPAAKAVVTWSKEIIDNVFDIVPAVKPQIAFFEQIGPDGYTAFFEVVKYAKEKGMCVIGDVKRSDIASTAAGYSNAFLGAENENEKKPDFITINPFLGYDSIEPYITNCINEDRGLFLLVKTSNKGSGDIQDLVLENGEKLYNYLGKLVQKWGEPYIGESGFSRIGAVVGATHPSQAIELRKLMPNVFFLIPGYGAQGGSGKDLKDVWVKNYGSVVNSSRGITEAYQSDKFKCNPDEFGKAAREAALEMKKDLEAFM